MKNKLKDVRLSAGMTQEQLANMIGSSKQYISSLENGNRDIRRIQQDTMQRICSALVCKPDDLIVKAEFDHDKSGNLIVDKLWLDPRYQNNTIAEIDGEFFMLPGLSKFDVKKPHEDQIMPMAIKVSLSAKEAMKHWYVMYKCVPRGGFDVKLGRAITESELSDLFEKYRITEDRVSNEFVAKKGELYGEYAKTYTAIQINVSGENPVLIEQELLEKGIEASAISADHVNIRIK